MDYLTILAKAIVSSYGEFIKNKHDAVLFTHEKRRTGSPITNEQVPLVADKVMVLLNK